MGKELVVRYSQMGAERMKEATQAAGSDPLDKAYALIDMVIKFSESPDAKGCLVGTFSQELSQTYPEIRCLCAQSFDRIADILKENLEKAKTKYAPEASFDVKSLAGSFIALMQGSLLLMKAQQDRSIAKQNLNHYKEYLKYLFGR